MALFGLSITKRVTYRDSTQDFSNVYHYQYTGLNPTATFANQIIDAIVALEKSHHATAVNFVYARLWSAGGSVASNQMIAQKPLTGTGALASDNNVDRERAILIRWPCGLDSRGRPKYLRKYYHLLSTGTFGVSPTTSVIAQFSGFTDAQRVTMATAADAFTSPTVNAQAIGLCSPSGEAPSGGPQAHKYYEHHQLGDMWR